MADNDITVREPQLGGKLFLEDYTSGAITTGARKKEWVCPVYGNIVDVIFDSGGANSGADDIADVDINGTTIFTTQGNRPTLTDGNTGYWAKAGEPEVTAVKPGDIISYGFDQVGSGAGSTRVSVLIVIAGR